jgi:predicted nucleotidyltransferase
MTTSTISLSRLEPPQLREALQAVGKGLMELHINFYLVGAVARDLYLRQVYNQKVQRPTLDLDVAVLMASQQDYEQLKQHLIQQYNFRETSTNVFALLHPNGTTVDLMPFGEIAGLGSWVTIQGRGMTSISVPGLAEAYEEAGELRTEEGQIWRVCTLPGMCVLKLLAWQDRPESRSKDLQDLAHIIAHYEYVGQDELFDQHYDLLLDASINSTSPKYMVQVSARLLGRHMQVITKRSQELHQRITGLLQSEITADSFGALAQAWARVNSSTIEETLDLLTRVLQGLTDELSN